MSNKTGHLYVVATPIGNLEDMTPRARRVLTEVDLIAAEDTRHTAKLLHHFSIHTPMISMHEHNEPGKVPDLIGRLKAGKCIALVSDAGTPLISDPGYHLVRAAHAAGVPVTPVPGCCAAAAALSAAGTPGRRFAFEGFPPARPAARRRLLQELRSETRTLVFYESPHRIMATLGDLVDAFGVERGAVLTRELTKKFETIRCATLGELREWLMRDVTQQQGEFVILVHGAGAPASADVSPDAERVLCLLLRELPLKKAAAIAAEITGVKKNRLYEHALRLQKR